MADMAGAPGSTTIQTTSTSSYQLTRHKSRYKVTKFALKIEGQEEPISLHPVCINQIIIMQDYDNCIQPIFLVKAVLPPMIIDYIDTHISSVSFIIRLQLIDDNSAADLLKLDKSPNRDGVDDICNDSFILFSVDSGKTPNLAEYKSVVETMTGEKKNDILYRINQAGENMANYTQQYELFLWKESDIYTMRNVVNYVFSNATIGDAAAGILSNAGFTKVLMAPPDNSSQMAQIIVPPMSLMNVFNYLQATYGMYNSDVIFFSDIYRTYVIDKSGMCKAYEDNEFTKTVFSVVDSYNTNSKDVGSATIDEKKEYHTKLDITSLYFRSLSSVNDVIKGNTNMFIDSRTNEITTVSGAGQQRGAGCVNVTTDQESSGFTKSRQANIISELALNLRVDNMTDYNYISMTPNKAFVFAFTNKDYYQYNGYYRLMKSTHIFQRMNQGEYLAITGSFEFTRKATLSEEERSTIEYDVFRTAQVTSEGVAKAEAKADTNNANDPSFNQSQTNQVAEGKMEAPAETQKSTDPPKDLSDNVYEYNKIKPTDDLGVINAKLAAQQKQLDAEKESSKAPIPLNEKNN